MNGYIYKITNKINNKVYIGKTLSSIEKRFKEHCKDAFKERNEKRPLYDAIRKYGVENFNLELVEEVPIDLLSDREKFWIKSYNSFHFGYNATLGGEGKQLYDYQTIVNGFKSGKLVKELAKEFGCSIDTISQALTLENIDTRQNYYKKCHKGLAAYDLHGNLIKIFDSRAEAVRWLQKQGYTKSTNFDNISAAVGRAANGQRNTAYKLKWKNV